MPWNVSFPTLDIIFTLHLPLGCDLAWRFMSLLPSDWTPTMEDEDGGKLEAQLVQIWHLCILEEMSHYHPKPWHSSWLPGYWLWSGSSEPCISYYHLWFTTAEPSRPGPAHESSCLVTFVLWFIHLYWHAVTFLPLSSAVACQSACCCYVNSRRQAPLCCLLCCWGLFLRNAIHLPLQLKGSVVCKEREFYSPL